MLAHILVLMLVGIFAFTLVRMLVFDFDSVVLLYDCIVIFVCFVFGPFTFWHHVVHFYGLFKVSLWTLL